jgi:plasmid stabilization system protein ParE
VVEYAVLWTETARRDLEAIVDYIAEDSLENALSVLDRLETRACALTTTPQRGRKVPELRTLDLHQYQELIENPWRIIDRIEQGRVLVVAVLDGRRDLQSLLIDRLVRS